MERFIRVKHDSKAGFRVRRISLLTAGYILFFAAVSIMGASTALGVEINGSVAVLPFQIHAEKAPGYLQKDIQKKLSVHLSQRGFKIVDPENVNSHPKAFSKDLAMEEFVLLGREVKADWLVTGSLTQIGPRYSFDLKIVDVSETKSPFLVFVEADQDTPMEEISAEVAANIENQIIGIAQVDAVEVRGNQRVEKEAVLALVRTQVGDVIDYDRLDQDLRDIYKMGYFKDVTIETEEGPQGKVVIFNVDEKPSVGKIQFEGNKEIKDDDLNEEVGIKTFSILDRREIQQSINRLRDLYATKGYYTVVIKESIEPLPNNEVLVKYEIIENEKVFVRKIEFSGNEKFDDGDLRDIMETSKKGLFSMFTQSGYLDKKKLEFDVHKITAFYHNHGYINARVGEPKISFNEGEGIAIHIEVHEGNQYRVNTVVVDGELISPAEDLLKMVKISDEEFFNREIVREDILKLRDYYSDEGYAYAEVIPRTKQDDANHTVDISYHFSKGIKVRFERINVYGNTVTRDKVVRRALKVVEGDYFSGKKMKRSTQELHRLGFFENVDVQTKKGSQEDLMVLDIKIEERPTGSFSFGGGYSSVDKLVGMLEVQQSNFMGYGQRLSASLRLGGTITQFDLRFTEPWLMDRPVSLDLRAFKWDREYDEYDKDSYGGEVALGRPLLIVDDYTRGWVRYSYEHSDIQDVDPGASFIIREMEGKSVTSSVSIGAKRSSIDKPWNTTSGSVNSITFTYAGSFLGGDNYFNKYSAKSAWFFPVFWDTVIMLQGRWGYIEKRSGGELPVYEKFFLGGINTIRGFEYGDVSPVDELTNDRVGGESMMVYNVEYRFPLIQGQGVVGLIFFDAGNVFTETTADNIEERKFAMSVGGGVRWYSPMGPLRLEWGYNLDPQRDEAQSRFEFSIGTTF